VTGVPAEVRSQAAAGFTGGGLDDLGDLLVIFCSLTSINIVSEEKRPSVVQVTDHQVCRLLYSQNHSQILPDFVYDSVNKTNHALVKDTYVDQATPVVQATTGEARSCLRADFHRFWRRVVHLKTITQQDAGAKIED